VADARTERWASHRLEMRQRVTTAAMSAIERDGPQVSMEEIAKEAGVPKPTLYRFFADKADLAASVADQAREDIAGRLAEAWQPGVRTMGELVHAGLTGYGALIASHPNVFRFLVGSDGAAPHATENAKTIAGQIVTVLEALNRALDGEPVDLSVYGAMIVGMVSGAATWWLDHAEEPGSIDRFVARLEPGVRAIAELVGAETGIRIDFDEPIPDTFPVILTELTPPTSA